MPHIEPSPQKRKQDAVREEAADFEAEILNLITGITLTAKVLEGRERLTALSSTPGPQLMLKGFPKEVQIFGNPYVLCQVSEVTAGRGLDTIQEAQYTRRPK
jgi:hypothetical protein